MNELVKTNGKHPLVAVVNRLKQPNRSPAYISLGQNLYLRMIDSNNRKLMDVSLLCYL